MTSLNKIFQRPPVPRAIFLILKWQQDPAPTHLPGLKFVLSATQDIEKGAQVGALALKVVDEIIYNIKNNEYHYATLATYPKTLKLMVSSRHKIQAKIQR